MAKQSHYWDSRRDKEIRQTLNELRALADAGYFEGLQPQSAVPEDLKLQSVIAAQLSKGAVFARKIQVLKPMDNPVGPALTQFMTQLLVRDRTEPYKLETRKL